MNELVLDRVTKHYGTKIACDRVSLRAGPGVYGLLGANGAGKTTLLRMICGVLRPTAGSIQFAGLDVASEGYRARLGYLPQDFGYYPEFTALDFLLYLAALKGLPRAAARSQSLALLEEVGLADAANGKIRTFSGGMRQRLGIAQALLGSPKFMIFDEPTAGLDPEERIKFRTLFSHSAEDKIVLLSTHIIEDIQAVCNRIIVINLGNILFDGTPEQVVQTAKGHTGSLMEHEIAGAAGDYEITSRISTSDGVVCRIVGTELPDIARPVEPTLEDAYIYLIHREGRRA